MIKLFVGLFLTLSSLAAYEVNIAIQSNEMLPSQKVPITLSWLKNKPRTITKDFYIWQYLQQEISPDEALQALGQAKRVNNKIFFSFAKKFKHDETYAVAQCMQAKTANLLDQHIDCIEIGLSTYDATKIDYESLETLIQRLNPVYPDHAKKLKIINSTIPFTKLISSDKDMFFNVFNNCGSAYREKYFNYHLPSRTLKRLKDDPKFENTIARIVLNNKLSKMQKSLLDVDDTNYLHITSFYLALNAIKHQKYDIALNYLNSAYSKAYSSFDKDKVRFWQYRLTQKQQYIDSLLSSIDNNIYSLLIQEQYNKKQNNIFYDISLSKNSLPSNYDINNPFNWVELIKQTKSYIDPKQYLQYKEKFNTPKTLPFLTYVTTKYEKYTNSYFITPFEEQFTDYTPAQKALNYAIAKQESHFIPGSISSAYALGVMQIMPFLGKSISRKLKEEFKVTDLLDINTNLKYAKFHIDSLGSRLKHPLFIAYAYNGGEGFVNRNIFSKELFRDGIYEPFLSMELIRYPETRKYGKKVLANYYIYYNHLNDENKITLTSLLQTLILPIPK